MTDPTRRRVLFGLSAVAAAVAAPLLWRQWRTRPGHNHPQPASAMPATTAVTSASGAPFQQSLRIPAADGLLANVELTQPLILAAGVAAFPVFAGASTAVWHYAGQVSVDGSNRIVANPLLHIRQGDTLDVTLDNQLREDTTIHWHGLMVDEANDGSGLHPVAAGARHNYRFRIDNRAGLYWYHAHPHGRTGLQLQHGLAGLLLVEDDEERALRERLQLRWGERDLPLLLADKQVADNAIVYKLGADDWIGNRMLVNWTPEPFLDVAPALYRFRIANACNARMLRLACVHDDQLLPMQLIGTDGGLLAQPWSVEDIFLAPAQRIDVLVDFSAVPAGERVTLRSLDYVAMENEDESGAFAPDPMADHPGAAPMGAPLEVMQFCVAGCATRSPPSSSAPRAPATIPATLSALPPPPDTRGWPVRALRLSMDADGMWFINDHNFHRDGHAPVFTVKRGTREVWEIRNSMTSMPHPLHVHGFPFRVVARSISPADVRGRQVAPAGLGPQDLGYNDTVVVWPGEIVRLAFDFSQPCSGTQRYMIHCHNLEHEDMGMMAAFAVED